ncbi:Tim44/TimA family putative adaptor protein [Stappia indica]|jgi:predicted lipid-binding transport protein (Tim44 family)|uniref:Tim44/TimA family putative adaptor protein n=1 Tax=Stappia indica TaxID=538381 RepID=A0A857C967_9HYPH|nr:Tim44/TimA family putative adaptor protein [Stappia indica]QGZ35421.1 Tim44/TimA family putative adaptor protein [Stappia indica]
MFNDITTIIFLVLAVVIFFRLRSVLGRRTGNERPPFDPYSAPERDNGAGGPAQDDNVIPLPGQAAPQGGPSPAPASATLDKVAPEGSALNQALRQILSVDRSFEPQGFLQGARAAYEMIVTAFANGDRKTLKNLLSKEVYDGFVAAISDRESRGETIESTFVGIDKADIVEAALKGSTAQVTVKFRSELISATRDRDGAIVDGDPNAVSDVTDIWTFARDTTSRDPNWRLVATESVE